MKLEPYITHTFEGLEGVNEAIKALHGGDCLRAVVHIAKNDIPSARVSLNYIYLDPQWLGFQNCAEETFQKIRERIYAKMVMWKMKLIFIDFGSTVVCNYS